MRHERARASFLYKVTIERPQSGRHCSQIARAVARQRRKQELLEKVKGCCGKNTTYCGSVPPRAVPLICAKNLSSATTNGERQTASGIARVTPLHPHSMHILSTAFPHLPPCKHPHSALSCIPVAAYPYILGLPRRTGHKKKVEIPSLFHGSSGSTTTYSRRSDVPRGPARKERFMSMEMRYGCCNVTFNTTRYCGPGP